MTMAPPAPSTDVIKLRRLSLNCSVISSSSGLHLLDSLVNGCPNARIGAATANVVDIKVDVLVRRLGNVLQKRGNRHDHAGLTVTALRYVHGRPDLLQHMLTLGIKAFDRGNLNALSRLKRKLARARRHAVNMDGAGAALGNTATIFGAGHAKMVAQNPE